MTTSATLFFLAFGYLATVAIEVPILAVLLSRRNAWKFRVGCGFWLTACTYPVVVLVIPPLSQGVGSWGMTVILVEIWVAFTEAALLRMLAGHRLLTRPRRDDGVVILANLTSFLAGELFLSSWLLDCATAVSG